MVCCACSDFLLLRSAPAIQNKCWFASVVEHMLRLEHPMVGCAAVSWCYPTRCCVVTSWWNVVAPLLRSNRLTRGLFSCLAPSTTRKFTVQRRSELGVPYSLHCWRSQDRKRWRHLQVLQVNRQVEHGSKGHDSGGALSLRWYIYSWHDQTELCSAIHHHVIFLQAAQERFSSHCRMFQQQLAAVAMQSRDVLQRQMLDNVLHHIVFSSTNFVLLLQNEVYRSSGYPPLSWGLQNFFLQIPCNALLLLLDRLFSVQKNFPAVPLQLFIPILPVFGGKRPRDTAPSAALFSRFCCPTSDYMSPCAPGSGPNCEAPVLEQLCSFCFDLLRRLSGTLPLSTYVLWRVSFAASLSPCAPGPDNPGSVHPLSAQPSFVLDFRWIISRPPLHPCIPFCLGLLLLLQLRRTQGKWSHVRHDLYLVRTNVEQDTALDPSTSSSFDAADPWRATLSLCSAPHDNVDTVPAIKFLHDPVPLLKPHSVSLSPLLAPLATQFVDDHPEPKMNDCTPLRLPWFLYVAVAVRILVNRARTIRLCSAIGSPVPSLPTWSQMQIV